MVSTFLFLFLSSLALADVVDPEPTDCPAGSRGSTGHLGPYCAADTCPVDGCPTGEECAPVGLCVETVTSECGGMQDPNDPNCTTTRYIAHAPCETQEDCSVGTCEIADRCAPPGRGCQPIPTPASAALAGLTLLAALGLRGRRG